MHSFTINCLLASLCLLFCSCGSDSSRVQTEETLVQPLEVSAAAWSTQQDTSFLQTAYQQGVKIVQYNQYMQQHAQSPTVKSFAEQSASWHQNVNEEIQQLASSSKLRLTEQSQAEIADALEELRQLPANEQELRYLELLSNLQNKALEQYDAASEKALDVALRNWAAQTLPSLQAHAQTVEELEQQLKDR